METAEIIERSNRPEIYHLGPPLDAGPLPSVFYFSLSGSESLTLEPFCQPAKVLASSGIRVFSLTLPGHEGVHPHPKAIDTWNYHIASGFNFASAFAEICVEALDDLAALGLADEAHTAAAGLSRGAFAAAHFAAAEPRIKTVLGFAPLTNLSMLPEFKSTIDAPLHHQLGLINYVGKLADKSLLFTVGNRDTCVGTSECYRFIEALTEASHAHKHRSPPVELIIYPSVGHRGHGTPPEIFAAGADWLRRRIMIA